ncbi:unnamed protein product [Rotaria magnacalcarata]|uniref:Uncharacterized protein n=1 Tax=Rotaria magnacalcarata TaxID=392030 RepID=A0A816ST46_9BILA|nr:unnamed protein product [Rotaria magnacalcarata]
MLSDLNPYTKLKPLCPSRWTVRASSMNVLLINYSLIKAALTYIGQRRGYPAPKANGLHDQMEKFSTYFGLKSGNIINSIYLRFKQLIFPLLCMVEQFLLQTVNDSETVDETNTIGVNVIREFLADDIDAEKITKRTDDATGLFIGY